MKKLLLILFMAASPLAFISAQQSLSASSAGKWSCSINCFFESCWVNCKLDGPAYAVCWCWWGFAYCECKETGHTSYVDPTAYGLTQSVEQRNNLLTFQQELNDLGYSQLASIALRIQEAIDAERPVKPLIREFGEIADALPEADQQVISSRIGDAPVNGTEHLAPEAIDPR